MAEKTLRRADLHGDTDRQQVYDLLHSFDSRGLDADALAARAIETLGIDGVHDAASLHAAFVARADCLDQLAGWPVLKVEQTPDEAERIMRHDIGFYGERYQLPEVIDYEVNPGNDHWAHDLNRFAYLAPLVTAYRATDDRRYGRKVVMMILHWIATTDVADAFVPGRSPYVWRSYLNVAIHLNNWSQALLQITRHDATIVAPAELLVIAKSVQEQLQFLDLVIPEQRNNWVCIGSRGVLGTLAMWPEMACEAELADRAFARIHENLQSGIFPDGAQKELTPTYQNVVSEMIHAALQSAAFVAASPPPELVDMYRQLLLYIRHLVSPDGQLVAFNDTDPDCANRITDSLATPLAREVLGAAREETLGSICFPHAGVMIMRQGSERGADELYMAFDGGPFGMSHQHEDKLGFWLSAYGRSLLVDPGRYLYDLSPESFRHVVLRTDAHSTICVDGECQNSRAHRDLWHPDAPQPLEWQVDPDGTVTAGAIYDLGYGEAQIQVTHRRRIVFHPAPGWWEITDEIDGDGAHRIDSHFQFAPGEVVVADGVAHTTYDDANLALFFAPTDWSAVAVYCGSEQPRWGWYSGAVNRIEPAPHLVLSHHGALPLRRRYALVPYRGTTVPPAPSM